MGWDRAELRILVVQESDWVERGPHQSHHLLERLRRRGHQVRVVDFEIGWRTRTAKGLLSRREEFTSPAKVVEGSDIAVVRPASVHLPLLDYASVIVTHSIEIRRQLRVFQPDVVLGLGLLNGFVGIRLARKAGVPFVYYLIDELHRLVPEPALLGLARVVEQANVRRASLVLSINQALWEYTIAMGAHPERAKILPAGVDLERYMVTHNGSDVRRRHGWGPDDFILFFMGWVYRFSGIREVAESVVSQTGGERTLRLVVVGKGDSWTTLERLASQKSAEGSISLIDFRPFAEMPSYLAAADVCLLPALPVPTMQNIVPIKMYEYLAAGKPVIATRLPGLVKEFGEGHGVVYVDSPSQVVPKARELARQGMLRQLGEQGRAFVSGNDWKTITDRFESYLVDLT